MLGLWIMYGIWYGIGIAKPLPAYQSREYELEVIHKWLFRGKLL